MSLPTPVKPYRPTMDEVKEVMCSAEEGFASHEINFEAELKAEGDEFCVSINEFDMNDDKHARRTTCGTSGRR